MPYAPRVRVPGEVVWTDFGDLHSSPQIYPADNWYCFEVYGPGERSFAAE